MRESHPEQSGLQRILHALRRPSRSQAVVALLLFVLGFGAVTQVRVSSADDTYSGRREQDLVDILAGLTGTADRARREIERLETSKRDLQSDTTARDVAIREVDKRLDTLNILAGLVPVSGPGIKVTITDETGRLSTNSLLDAVQELRTAGAEAMQINGRVRLAAQSSFDETTGGIDVDGVALSSPYTLEVIGEPHTLRGALTFPDGPLSVMTNEDGCAVEITDETKLSITAVRDPVKPRYASATVGQ